MHTLFSVIWFVLKAPMTMATHTSGVATNVPCPTRRRSSLGGLMVCLLADFVNPNSLPNCKHDETCKLIHLFSEKISNPDLQDTLFFVCPKKIAGGQCNFVVDATTREMQQCTSCCMWTATRRLTTMLRSTEKPMPNLTEWVYRH